MTDITLAADAWKDIDQSTEALIDKWLVAEGDTVRAGQPVAQVVLVKSSQEVVAPVNGQIEKILLQAGDTFARGQAIARLKESA